MNTIIIQPKAVFKTIQENLDALRGIDYQQLTKAEKDEMRQALQELKEIAERIKQEVSAH